MEFVSPKKSYFAAANGFSGFRSYFGKVFDPKEYTRVFIIKGGAGTGKSTFMKRLISDFSGIAEDVHAIYCSSDVNSLDGVILKFDKASFAVLDGTAPHATDTKFPGAADELLNLGEFWDEGALTRSREEIIEISEKKKNHYKRAYEYLSAAGDFYEKRARLMKSAFTPRILSAVSDVISDFGNIKLGRSTNFALISAFGKEGYKRIFDNCYDVNKGLSVSGIFGSEHLFLSRLESECLRRNFAMTTLLSPYSHNISEGLYFTGEELLVLADTKLGCEIRTEELLNDEYIEKHIVELTKYEENFTDFLTYAREEFADASREHFKLEEIYSSAMDFTAVDRAYQRLREKIGAFI